MSSSPVTGSTPPLVSVLVPLFNHANYVTELLDSIVCNAYPNLEIVVVDDGSTDSSRAVVETWASHSPLAVRLVSRPNRGITRTLNELLNAAAGEYVVPIASDDRLVRGSIGRRIDWLRSHPGHRAVFGDCHVIDEVGKRTANSALVELFGANKARLTTDPTAEIISRWSVPGPALLAERSALLAIGGYDERLSVEDWDLYLRMAARGWVGFIDEVVAEYRRHTAGASMKLGFSLRHASEMRGVAERALPLYHGYHRLLVLRQIARWKAREALLSQQRFDYFLWGITSRLLASISRVIGAATSGVARQRKGAEKSD